MSLGLLRGKKPPKIGSPLSGRKAHARRDFRTLPNGVPPESLPQALPHETLRRKEPRFESGFSQYRHGDSNPGFRRERAAS